MGGSVCRWEPGASTIPPVRNMAQISKNVNAPSADSGRWLSPTSSEADGCEKSPGKKVGILRDAGSARGEFGVHPTLNHGWTKQLGSGAEEIFGGPAKAASAEAYARQAERFEQIGRLK